MVFMEFVRKCDGQSEFFVGSTERIVLADTCGGQSFGSIKYGDHRLVSESEICNLNLRLLSSAIGCIERGSSESFYLGVCHRVQ